jgi:hypothetical protein
MTLAVRQRRRSQATDVRHGKAAGFRPPRGGFALMDSCHFFQKPLGADMFFLERQ